MKSILTHSCTTRAAYRTSEAQQSRSRAYTSLLLWLYIVGVCGKESSSRSAASDHRIGRLVASWILLALRLFRIRFETTQKNSDESRQDGRQINFSFIENYFLLSIEGWLSVIFINRFFDNWNLISLNYLCFVHAIVNWNLLWFIETFVVDMWKAKDDFFSWNFRLFFSSFVCQTKRISVHSTEAMNKINLSHLLSWIIEIYKKRRISPTDTRTQSRHSHKLFHFVC